MIVVLTDAAKADLEAIAEWIAQDNPQRALILVTELRQACAELADAPRAYPLVPRQEDRGIRRRVFRNYLIFYRLSHDAIEVVHVLHGARDWEALLFPDI